MASPFSHHNRSNIRTGSSSSHARHGESSSSVSSSLASAAAMINPLHLISKVGSVIAKPIVRIGEMFTIQENEDEEGSGAAAQAEQIADNRLSLEGTLYCRKGSTKSWRRRLVVLKFDDGGSLECYKMANQEGPKKVLKDMYSQLHRQSSVGSTRLQTRWQTLRIVLRPDMPWVVRDIENDQSAFVIEIPTEDPGLLHDLTLDNGDFIHHDHDDYNTESLHNGSFEHHHEEDDEFDFQTLGSGTHDEVPLQTYPEHHHHPTVPHHDHVQMTLSSKEKLEKDFRTAQKKHRPLRLYFKCPRRGNEKALWLRGFAKLDRLSSEARNKRKFFGKLAQIGAATSRIRKDVAEFTRDLRHLEMGGSMLSPQYLRKNKSNSTNRPMPVLQEQVERREFRVSPNYCYPHVWMTQNELLEECNMPSTQFHDLSLESVRGKEIGALSVEVLQCVGLPRLDRGSDSDAVVYLVCGSYAFATDVIPNNANPIWLRKSRRACTIPVFHGYSRLFIGVFDDNSGPRDDMAGRAVIDLANLRPQSRYDVILPLRMSAHVYSRRKRGAIRLRFQLDWHSERAALLSYLPASIRTFRKDVMRREEADTRTTVMCTDAGSFRNIAMTVHGVHLPDKFSMNRFRATLKEITFSRKIAILIVKTTIRQTMNWQHPAISLFVFCAWMHCIYKDSFGLVPAYFLSFIMLHMLRNYVRYSIDGPSSRGFVPPTWEEMFLSLATGTPCIKPISMIPLDGDESIRSPVDAEEDDDLPLVRHEIKTHTPLGKSLFRTIGFLESEDTLNRIDPDERHIEFPFAEGELYPKLTVREAKVIKYQKSKNNEETTHDGQTEKRSKRESTKARKTHQKDQPDDGSEYTGDHRHGILAARKYSSSDEDFAMSVDYSANDHASNSADHGNHLNQIVEIPSQGAQSSTIAGCPDQDIDYVHKSGSGKKMTDDLGEIRENLHRLTWNLFNDKTYVIKHPDAAYFGHNKKPSKKKDVNRDLQKLVGEGTYSTSNPFISRIAPYMIPLIGGSMSFLSVLRTVFNVFTWRDRFLSFWVSIFGITMVLILFLIPWRPVLLVVGFIVVGPQVSKMCRHWQLPSILLQISNFSIFSQNLIYRLVRERRGDVLKAATTEEPEVPYELPKDQPLFKAHALPNQKHEDIDMEKIDAREVHHVVVPYAPLASSTNRFNDWPPEPEYAHVKPKPKKEAMGHRHSTGDGNSMMPIHSNDSASQGYYKLTTLPGEVPSIINTPGVGGAGGRLRSHSTDDMAMFMSIKAADGIVSPLRRRSQTVDVLNTDDRLAMESAAPLVRSGSFGNAKTK
jgi:hypothetical protein